MQCWLIAILGLLFLQFLLRLTLLLSNVSLVHDASLRSLVQSFAMGMRFDLRMATYAVLPMVLLPVIRAGWFLKFCRLWLLTFALGYTFLGLVEVEFYAEFQQRLNSLVFQYLQEDPITVLSMLWHGLPIVKYLVGFMLLAIVCVIAVGRVFRGLTLPQKRPGRAMITGVTLAFIMLATSVLAVRGTLRTGPPLRWGDAFVTDNMFLNQLALNGSFTLAKAWINRRDGESDAGWLSLNPALAQTTTRELLFSSDDVSTSSEQRPIGRISGDKRAIPATPKNVIVILMESFSARYVGAMGNSLGVTPAFDALTQEGMLFTRFFSNGTHTHQGMFATLSCFPNLPGHEYLMQQPEGRHEFSGLAKLLPDHQKLFVYNGDFSWDNQQGFFSNQGFQKFVGRNDYVNPKHIDPVWGVSDEDMFDRSLVELDQLDPDKPFFAVLQTLSNHLPYSLPEPLPIEPVMVDGEMNERLTAMKYADWALGEFMAALKQKPFFKETLVVLVGDHGFGVEDQLTEVNLLRFHVPLLFLSPYLDEQRGIKIEKVGSQVDIAPTIVSLIGAEADQQCWGRDLFDSSRGDSGYAIIKPSGSEPTMAMVQDDKIMTYEPAAGARLYQFDLASGPGKRPGTTPINNSALEANMTGSLLAYVQTALTSLRENRASN